MGDAPLPADGTARRNTGVAHTARVRNHWIGGKDDYEVGHRVGDHVAAVFPLFRDIARADHAFLGRTVAFLAGERGVRQSPDLGTGLPAADSTHEAAQRVAPDARIVHVDDDPAVPDTDEARDIVRRAVAAVPSGSHLA
ncbi:hypothetical protein GCM10020295_71450 [Streptomyces cinereospinus]